MTIKRKFSALLLGLTLAFGFVGCSSSKPTVSSTEPITSSSSESPSSPEAPDLTDPADTTKTDTPTSKPKVKAEESPTVKGSKSVDPADKPDSAVENIQKSKPNISDNPTKTKDLKIRPDTQNKTRLSPEQKIEVEKVIQKLDKSVQTNDFKSFKEGISEMRSFLPKTQLETRPEISDEMLKSQFDKFVNSKTLPSDMIQRVQKSSGKTGDNEKNKMEQKSKF